MRSRRKHVSAIALLSVLGLAAAACGSSSNSSSAATTAGASTTASAATSGGAATTTGGGSGKCQPGTATNNPIPTQTADGTGKSVGLLFDLTGRGDKSFNDGAAAGLDKAKADFGITGNESTPTAPDGSDRPDRIKAMVGKNDLIVAVGFLWNDYTNASATQNPNQKYAQIDGIVYTLGSDGKPTTTLAPNARSMVFAAEQSSFLVGVAAACASKSGKVGFIGGVENDLIKDFQAGFDAGVKAVNPDAIIKDQYLTQPPDFTGFTDPAKGKAVGQGHVRRRHRRDLRRRRQLGQRLVPGGRARAARSPATSMRSAWTATSTRRSRPTRSPMSSRRR